MFEDVLLDALSVVVQSRNHNFARTTAALSTIEGGLLVLIAGRLTADAARDIAATRREGRQGIALLLAVSTWTGLPRDAAAGGSNGHRGQNGQSPDNAGGENAGSELAQPDLTTAYVPPAETAAAEAVLRAAGWRVVTVDAATPLAVAWQRLPRHGSYAVQGGLPNLGVVT